MLVINFYNEKHRGGSMRARILPLISYHTDHGHDHYDGQGVSWGLSTASMCFLFLLPKYRHFYAIIMD